MLDFYKVYMIGFMADSQNTRKFLIINEIHSTEGVNYKKFEASEDEVKKFWMSNNKACINFTVDNTGRVKSTCGDIARYDLSKHKVVRIILAEIRNNDKTDVLLGYRVADSTGSIKRIMLKECIALGMMSKKTGSIPFANAQFVGQQEGKRAYYRAYTSEGFRKEYIKAKSENKNAKPAVINKKENEKDVRKLEDIFSKEQINELKQAKVAGVDIRIIGNAKLSAAQMHEIWMAEKQGYAGRKYADPAYKLENMEFMRAELETGGKIDFMLNPKYNTDQLLELSRAYLEGIDMNAVANPDYSADRMDQIIDIESRKLWRNYRVIKGKSLNE